MKIFRKTKIIDTRWKFSDYYFDQSVTPVFYTTPVFAVIGRIIAGGVISFLKRLEMYEFWKFIQ